MHRLLKGKWLFIWIGAVVLIAVGVVLFLGIKSVEVDSDLSVRLIFGKMGENDSHRVLTRAEEYLKGYDYATCRRLANFVVAHGGKYADDGLLLVARAFHREGDIDGTYETLNTILVNHPGCSAVEEAEFGNLATRSLELLLAEVPLDISRVGEFLRLLADGDSPYFPEAKKQFDETLSGRQDLTVEYIFESKKVMVLKSDAVKDAKAEALFFSKQKTPDKMIEKINTLIVLEGLIDSAAIDTYVRKNLVYDTKVDEVERSPLYGEELAPVSTGDEFVKQDFGYKVRVRCIGKIEDFSLADLFKQAGVDPYQVAIMGPKAVE